MPKLTTKFKCPPSRLAALVRKMIKKLSPEAVAVSTGVPVWWARDFAHGLVKSPGVDRIEYLYTKLTGKDLAL